MYLSSSVVLPLSLCVIKTFFSTGTKLPMIEYQSYIVPKPIPYQYTFYFSNSNILSFLSHLFVPVQIPHMRKVILQLSLFLALILGSHHGVTPWICPWVSILVVWNVEEETHSGYMLTITIDLSLSFMKRPIPLNMKWSCCPLLIVACCPLLPIGLKRNELYYQF